MRFKTILVHIADDDAGRARTAAACDFAEARDAKVIGLAAAAQPTPILVEGSAAAAGVWAEQAAECEAAAREAVRVFEAEASRRGVEAEARLAPGFEENAGGALAINARYCDVSFVGGRDGVASRSLADALIDGALFDSGRPAIAIPAKGAPNGFGAKPMLAWDGGLRAARAAREALPFLTAADEVLVCVAKTYFGMGRHGEEPGADVARFLAAHGCKVAVEVIEPDDRSVAKALTGAARAAGCDLIAMGAFGHSRLRESIFGGVTTELIDAPPMPLLLAH